MKRRYYFKDENDHKKFVKHYEHELEYCLKMKRAFEGKDKYLMYGCMVKNVLIMLNQLKNNKVFIVYQN